ncbi:MAG: excinuclease ABC subunit UvrB [Bacteroidales bacterium]
MDFELTAEYKPTGDQPTAIAELVKELNAGTPFNTLLGVTGSGKTFTIANVVAQLNRPTLVLSHNKTLAAQLYGEFKNFFPNNAIEYFVSYYDYYQPEAYMPVTDTYIEKDLQINDEIEKLRLSTTSSLLSGRRDVLVVSSVSCLYGIGNPQDFHSNTINLHVGQIISRQKLLYGLVDGLYSRNEASFDRGTFRVRGDTVDVHLAYGNYAYRIVFFGDEIESLQTFEPVNGGIISNEETAVIYPATIFVTTKERLNAAIVHIQDDMMEQCAFFEKIGKPADAKRLKKRVEFDIEMMKEVGYCSGIENYSRYFDGRKAGERPFCLVDYFPKDFLLVVDESHVTIPQIRAMYGGDHARKQNLVEYGFRLPSAMDNRPLKFEEFESLIPQSIFVSATPADFELQKSNGVVIEQVIRPTGLLDPVIEVRSSESQVDDLIGEIIKVTAKDERILVTTLTKRMAEELTQFLEKAQIRCRYIHSDIDTLERVQIMEDLRRGMFDVLVGVNLLREGLDLPEVSLVAILDADKEGFLRNTRSLTQTAGRAARNVNGRVIMYADKMTKSINETISETNRRRERQMAYNQEHGITPTQVIKTSKGILSGEELKSPTYYIDEREAVLAADPVLQYMSNEDLEKSIARERKAMEAAAKKLDFVAAASHRDEMYALQKLLASRGSGAAAN